MLANIILIFGILLMTYSVLLWKKLFAEIKSRKARSPWQIILVLICFFLFGYIGYFFIQLLDITELTGILVGFIFFLGALFVMLILMLNYQSAATLNANMRKLKNINSEIGAANRELAAKDEEMKKLKDQLEKRNSELVEMMDDFYTMRVGLQEEMEAGIIEEENKKIKKRLDSLRNI